MAPRGSGSSGSIMIIIVLGFIVSLCVISMSYGVVELGDTNKTGIETIKDISSGDKSLNELIDTFKTDGVKSIKDLLSGKVTFNEFKSNLNRDPKPCVGDWGNWDACSKTCGGGLKIREWEVSKDEMDGGTCVNRGKTEDASCNTQACSTSGGGGGSTPTPAPSPTPSPAPAPAAKNCTGSWGSWGNCSKTCGRGTKSRSWNVTSNEKNGGTCAKRNKTESASCNTQACPTVDTTPYEDRAKSTLNSTVQGLINTYGALGTYRRCMGNSYGWQSGKKCGKTTGSASNNVSPLLYPNYDDPYKTGIMDMTVAQHWVANDNGVNCRDLFTYELDKQKVGVSGENVEVWRVPANKLYKTDYPGAANAGKDLYCPPLYYKVVT